MNSPSLIIITSAVLATAACSQTPSTGSSGTSADMQQTVSLSDLTSREWLVEDIMGGGIIDSSHATLTFSGDGRLSGAASCNSYSGTFEMSSQGLTVGPLRTTRKACPPSLMNQEQRFLQVLSQPLELSIDETEELTLRSSAGTISAR